MKILAVDDEKLMLSALENAIREAVPSAEISAYRNGKDALEFARNNKVDVAFLDIQMSGMNGLQLARELLKLYPEINIIFCTGYRNYMSEAFREIRCNGYIMKPVDGDLVREELKHLRRPFEQKQIQKTCFS